MANTTFVNQNTVVMAEWLNDVNDTVYTALGDGTNAPLTAADVKTNLALNNVDNTSDANKPVSTATQNALDLKANLATTTPRTTTTGSAQIPAGTTAERDATPAAGYFRFNGTLGKFEGYNGSAWGAVGGGATGGGSDEVFIENGQTVTTSYTITTGKNAVSAGPITINAGATVTVPSGQVWTIV